MNEYDIERLVLRVLQRLRKPILLIVTPPLAYQKEVFARLSACGQYFHILIAEDVAERERWLSLGEPLSAAGDLTAYGAVVVPFFDYPLAAGLMNGALQNTVIQRLHDALLARIPTLALRYYSDPRSELNQIRGYNRNPAYSAHMQSTFNQMKAFGVTLCTLDELTEQLANGVTAAPVSDSVRQRYITLEEISCDPTLACAPGVRLTDAACDFLRNRKNNLTL
ncbi:hypothetical protein [Cedecea colo]|uniref:Flavoprotein n=1 Tax=Cedecea colo TaxID=2552946 RepID=A0ABX0VQ09_9ENTR|nr:hypothetical protein [Cedecea colo]NIY49063.1 hypothetical protein [Cedecea colo]